MSTVAFIERCVAAGMPLDMALKAAKAFEVELAVAVAAALEGRRAKDRERQARKRERDGDVTEVTPDHVTSRDNADVTPVTGQAEILPLPPSLPPVPPIPPTHTRDEVTSRTCEEPIPKARDPAGKRLPPDWTPTPKDRAFAEAEGLNPQEIDRAADEFRDYWCARSGRDAAKRDWSATWRNRVRDVADRKRRNGPRVAGQAGAGGFGPRPSSMAGILAQRRGIG